MFDRHQETRAKQCPSLREHATPHWASGILDAMSDLVIVVEADGRLGYVSPSVAQLLGHDPAAWIGRSGLELIHPADVGVVTARLRQVTSGISGKADHLVVRARRADDTFATLEASGMGRVDIGGIHGVVIALRDTHGRQETTRELDETRERLEFVRSHDSLTQLPNQSVLERHLHRLTTDRRALAVTAGVIVARLAGLDRVRETYGTETTDAILRTLATELRATVPSLDVVAVLRTGEFVVVTEQVHADALHGLARMVSRLTALPATETNDAVDIRLAVGVSIARPHDRPTMVLDQASVAARWGEAIGDTQPTLYDDELRAAVEAKRTIHVEIDRAVRSGELELHYQPIVASRSSSVLAFEGLLRHRKVDGTIISAGEFIPQIEGSDLMLDVGEFVLREGCRQLAAWQVEFGDTAPVIALNVSARQLQERSFAALVLDQVAAAGARADGLCLELTETHGFEGAEVGISQLAELRRHGVSIALDDFGTGYSSLQALQQFGADVLKIDRGFVSRLGSDPGAAAIVRASLDMGHAFGMNVVAEGVETIAQRSQLLALGCDRIQGWLIAAALEPQDAYEMIRQQSAVSRSHDQQD